MQAGPSGSERSPGPSCHRKSSAVLNQTLFLGAQASEDRPRCSSLPFLSRARGSAVPFQDTIRAAKPGAALNLRPSEAGARGAPADLRQRQKFARWGRGSSRHAASGTGDGRPALRMGSELQVPARHRGSERESGLREGRRPRRALLESGLGGAYVWGLPGCCAVLAQVARPRRWLRGEAGDPRGAGRDGSCGSLPRRPRAAQSPHCVQGARPRRDSVADVATPLPRRAGSPDRPGSDAEANSAHDPARVADAQRPLEHHAPEDWLRGAQRGAGKPKLTDGGGGRWHGATRA